MSPTQVIAASAGKAKAVSRDYGADIGFQQFLAQADQTSGGRAYLVEFYFDKGATLSLVRLTPKDFAQCPALEAELLKRHRPKSPSGRFFWLDKAAGQTVSYNPPWKPGDSCFVAYAPL